MIISIYLIVASYSLGSTGELVTSSRAVINQSPNIDFQHNNNIPMTYDNSEQPVPLDDDDDDDEILSIKKQKVDTDTEVEKKPVQHKIQAIKELRLPDPCPLPNNFSMITTKALENNSLKGNVRL